MTWTSVASYGTANNKTSGTSLEIFSPGSPGLSVGDVIVVSIASDNVQTTDGESTLVSSVIGNHSGTFTKALEYTNGESASAAGATCSVWYKRIDTAVDAGDDTITITFGSSVTAKAANAYIFNSDKSPIVLAASQGSVHDTDPANMTISGLTNRNYLFIRSVATERGNFGFGASANYTAYGADTTTSGGNASDISIGSEYRIFTSTGDSTDPITGDQSASVYIALADSISYALVAQKASFGVSVVNTNLRRSFKLTAEVASFSLTGQDATLQTTKGLNAETGVFVVTAIPATLNMIAKTEAFALSGSDVAFQLGRTLTASSVSFSLTARRVNLLKPAPSPHRRYFVTAENRIFKPNPENRNYKV